MTRLWAAARRATLRGVLRRAGAALAMLATGASGCAAAGSRDPSGGTTEPPPARVLVIGDVQLMSPFKGAPSLSTWRHARLDTAELAARLGEALRDTRPTHLVQTGDLVDLNESAVLEVRDPAGALLERERQPLQEWQPVLALFPARPLLFPVVGNHERYGELVVQAALLPDGDRLEIRKVDLTKKLGAREVHAQTLTHFPYLGGLAEFHGQSGSYHVAFPRFCLLSLDGADLDVDATLFAFIDEKLGGCAARRLPAIVVNHYPLFSGRPRAEDGALELRAHRDGLIEMFTRHRVALVMSGHEHFYLRYLEEGRRRAGYAADLPPRPVYVTVSDFANPYSRALERLDPATVGEGFRYFRGTHYALVEVGEASVEVTVRGYRPQTSAWETVDSFRVPP
jgi:hypothetical protein